MDSKDQKNPLKNFEKEVSSLIGARYPLIYLNTYEEDRCLQVLQGLAKKREGLFYVWSRTQGVFKDDQPVSEIKDPMAVLKWYGECHEKSILVLKDFHPYLKDPGILRKLRDLNFQLKKSAKNIVFISPVLSIPAELSKEVTVVEVPLPTREEIRELLERAVSVLSEEKRPSEAEVGGLIDSATGLTYDEVENVLAKSIVWQGQLDRRMVQQEKRQIAKKSGLLEFLDTDDGKTSQVGGLHNLRKWLSIRRHGLSQEARTLKLPMPKGILLVGIPGCGKSLTAMTVGREWQLPLLRLDMGRVFSGIVGSSEGNIRQSIQTCEAIAPCVLWIDEIEKGLSGTRSSGSTDGGTTSRVFGTLLTWMQEKRSPVFVLATANDISQLPPELLRKGRFDEIFFVDLPCPEERGEIFQIQLSRFGWEIQDINLSQLVEKTAGFSGAEIEQVLVAGRYLAFAEGVPFSQQHVLQSVIETIPLSKTMADRIDGLRSWAKHRARLASEPSNKKVSNGDRFVLAAPRKAGSGTGYTEEQKC